MLADIFALTATLLRRFVTSFRLPSLSFLYGITGKDISRLFAELATDKTLVGKEKTEYIKLLNQALKNPEDFPEEILQIQKKLGIDIDMKDGGLAKILEV